uniref:p0047B08.1 protein n=1 Tax=Oryza sativa subsp. japonica TaxID=39947 RepID=Q94JB0_ORYSJ|nr:P0047B08.1 [Oryza sativa Japonica Group]
MFNDPLQTVKKLRQRGVTLMSLLTHEFKWSRVNNPAPIARAHPIDLAVQKSISENEYPDQLGHAHC